MFGVTVTKAIKYYLSSSLNK